MNQDAKPETSPDLQLVWGAREARSAARTAFDRLPVTADQVEELIRRTRAA
jgi:hypothetical protein